MQVQSLNWQHISMFGSLGESLRRFADQKGYVCWDVHIQNEAKFLNDAELDYAYESWINQMNSEEWGEPAVGREGSDDPEDYPDWCYLRSGAAACAVEKVIRSIDKWRKE